MSDTRDATDGSVHDASVRTPVGTGGTNADGTPTYDLGTDIGGINAAKIVYEAGTQLVSDFIGWMKIQFNALLANFNSHYQAPLGLSNTHPIPTASPGGRRPIKSCRFTIRFVNLTPTNR